MDDNPMYNALMEDIIENPYDDTPRLVMADWLIDNDRSDRAEFIRVQLELARLEKWVSPVEAILYTTMTSTSLEYEQLKRRESDLFYCLYDDPLPGRFVPNLDGKVGRDAPHAHYRRGFVEAITLSRYAYTKEIAKFMFENHPITRVKLEGYTPRPTITEYCYAWTALGAYEHTLPPKFFNLLSSVSGFKFITSTSAVYSTRMLAEKALDDVAFLWGMNLVVK